VAPFASCAKKREKRKENMVCGTLSRALLARSTQKRSCSKSRSRPRGNAFARDGCHKESVYVYS